MIRRRLADERGITLIETLMVIVFLGIVGAAFATLFSGMVRHEGQIREQSLVQDEMRGAVDRMLHDIRTAYSPTAWPIESIAGSQITFTMADRSTSPVVYRVSYQGRRWIACRLAFKERKRELLQPGRYTELFFLDDATALAAGHRPCAECRRADYEALRAVIATGQDARPGADAIDRLLHAERLERGGRRRTWESRAGDLPDGAFVLHAGEPWLVLGDELRRWRPSGYDLRRPAPPDPIVVLTPPTLVRLLRAGPQLQVPLLHPSALP